MPVLDKLVDVNSCSGWVLTRGVALQQIHLNVPSIPHLAWSHTHILLTCIICTFFSYKKLNAGDNGQSRLLNFDIILHEKEMLLFLV